MASLLKLTFRGAIGGIPWAVNTWWGSVSPLVVIDPSAQAGALALGGSAAWLEKITPIQHNAVSTNRVIVEGYDDPAAFHDAPLPLFGQKGGDMYASFSAYGFRQYKGVQGFRTSTHRVPGLREENVINGQFATDPQVSLAMIEAAASFFDTNITQEAESVLYEFEPVLIRTQYTPRGEGEQPTTIFDPPQVSKVAGATFYGVTSQVSRKRISNA